MHLSEHPALFELGEKHIKALQSINMTMFKASVAQSVMYLINHKAGDQTN